MCWRGLRLVLTRFSVMLSAWQSSDSSASRNSRQVDHVKWRVSVLQRVSQRRDRYRYQARTQSAQNRTAAVSQAGTRDCWHWECAQLKTSTASCSGSLRTSRICIFSPPALTCCTSMLTVRPECVRNCCLVQLIAQWKVSRKYCELSRSTGFNWRCSHSQVMSTTCQHFHLA